VCVSALKEQKTRICESEIEREREIVIVCVCMRERVR